MSPLPGAAGRDVTRPATNLPRYSKTKSPSSSFYTSQVPTKSYLCSLMKKRNHISGWIRTALSFAVMLLFLSGYAIKYGHEYGLILPHKAETHKHVCNHPHHHHDHQDESETVDDCVICAFDFISQVPDTCDFCDKFLPLLGKTTPGFELDFYTSEAHQILSGRGPPYIIS